MLSRKQKTIYFNIDQTLMRRHHILRLSLAFLNVFAIILTLGISLLTNNNKPALAVGYNWDGGGTTNNWSDCDNWSINICPTSADSVIFSNGSVKNSVVDASFQGTVAGMSISLGYTGTITLQRSLTLDGNYSQASGTVNAGSHALDLNLNFSLSGGTFTASSNTTSVGGAFTISGSSLFNHNNGTLIFDGSTATITCNNAVFYHASFAHTTNTKTVSSSCSLPLGEDPTVGRLTLNGTLTGTGTLTLTYSAANNFNAGANLVGFNGLVGGGVTISGADLDLSSYDLVDINHPFALNSGSLTAPSSQIRFGASFTITGGNFVHNDGTIIFDGISSVSITCNNAVFNHVQFRHSLSTKTVNENCILPLGQDPLIGEGAGTIVLRGTLNGGGLLDFQPPGFTGVGQITLYPTHQLVGFNGLNMPSVVIAANTNADFSTYETFYTKGRLSIAADASFIAPAGAMTVGELIVNSGGTFHHNGGTTIMMPYTNTQSALRTRIGGDIMFFNLRMSPETRVIRVVAGSTITVDGALNLTGVSQSELLTLESETSGTQWNIDAQGQRNLQYLSVQDSNNINGAAMLAYDSQDLGNNTYWEFLDSPTTIAQVTSGNLGTESSRLAELGDDRVLLAIAGGGAIVAAAGLLVARKYLGKK